MFFTWIFSIVSLVSLLVAKFFFVLSPDTNSLLLALALIVSAPWIPLVFSYIKRDIESLHPLTTRASLGGYLILLGLWMIMALYFHAAVSTQIFVLVLGFSLFFHVDARVFFALALGGLIVTVWSLVFDMTAWAESASIIVYLALVIGVFVEIGSRWLNRIHDDSKILIHISSEFKTSYQQALAEYTWIITVILQLIFIIALLCRGTLWDFDYQMLLYLSFGIWIFFALHLLSSDKTYRIQDFMVNRLSKKYIVGLFREKNQYIKYILTGVVFSVLVVLIDWTLILRLPLITLISLIALMALLIGIGVYGIVSFFYRR